MIVSVLSFSFYRIKQLIDIQFGQHHASGKWWVVLLIINFSNDIEMSTYVTRCQQPSMFSNLF